MKKFRALLTVGGLIIGMSAADAFASMDIKFAHVVNENDDFHVCALKLKERIEKWSGVELTVSIFPNAKLGMVLQAVGIVFFAAITFCGAELKSSEAQQTTSAMLIFMTWICLMYLMIGGIILLPLVAGLAGTLRRS